MKKMSIIYPFLFIASCATNVMAAPYGSNGYATRTAQQRNESPEQLNNKVFSPVYLAEEGMHLSAYGEFLYWNVSLDSMPYIQTQPVDPIPVTDRTLVAPVASYEPGYRVGGRIGLMDTGWNIDGNYSRLHTNYTQSTADEPDVNLFQYWITSTDEIAGNIIISTAETDLKFNQLDLTLQRTLRFSEWMQLTPFFGYRQLWFDTNYQVILNDHRDEPVEVTITTDSNRPGMLFGAEAEFTLPYGFGVFGSGALSMVYGNHNMSYRSTRPNQRTRSERTTISTQNYKQMQQLFDIGAGVFWRYAFLEKKIGVQAKVGYEMHVLPNELQVLREVTVESGQSNTYLPEQYTVSLHGFVFSAGVFF